MEVREDIQVVAVDAAGRVWIEWEAGVYRVSSITPSGLPDGAWRQAGTLRAETVARYGLQLLTPAPWIVHPWTAWQSVPCAAHLAQYIS